MKRFEIQGSAVFLNISMDGDWMLRDGAETSAMMGTLDTTLWRELHWNVRCETGVSSVRRQWNIMAQAGLVFTREKRTDDVRFVTDEP